jgi:hypothetical protein
MGKSEITRCYCCEVPLTQTTASIEHIISNACGGRLKSSKLLCKACNSIFGDKFDAELAQTVNPIANLLLIERDRGEPQKIRSTSIDSGKQYDLEYGGEISHTRPEIELVNLDSEKIEDRKIKVRAPNVEILNQVLLGLKRKYPTLNIEQAIRSAVTSRFAFNEEVEIKTSIGGTETFKSILKTAINFYIHCGGQRRYIEHLLPHLKGSEVLDVVWFHYPEKFIFNPQGQDVTHVLKLVGDPGQRILYSYVELFNIHCFIVKLNCEFNGPAIDCDYIFNVHTLEVSFRATDLSLDRSQLLELFSKKETISFFDQVKARYARVLNISQRLQARHYRNKVISEAVHRTLGNLPDGTALDEITISTMRQDVLKALSPFF